MIRFELILQLPTHHGLQGDPKAVLLTEYEMSLRPVLSKLVAVRCLDQRMQSSAFSRSSRFTTAGRPFQDPIAKRMENQSTIFASENLVRNLT
jgi:hypothetical protein